MSEKIESMAVVGNSLRELSDAELDQIFGGQCHWEVDDCFQGCAGIPGYSYEICFLNGQVICSVGPAYDPWMGCL